MFDIKNNYKRHIDIMMNSNCKGQGKYRKSKHTLISINCKLTYAHPLRNNLTYSTRVLVFCQQYHRELTGQRNTRDKPTDRPRTNYENSFAFAHDRAQPT